VEESEAWREKVGKGDAMEEHVLHLFLTAHNFHGKKSQYS
jgi:hypothetical protein